MNKLLLLQVNGNQTSPVCTMPYDPCIATYLSMFLLSGLLTRRTDRTLAMVLTVEPEVLSSCSTNKSLGSTCSLCIRSMLRWSSLEKGQTSIQLLSQKDVLGIDKIKIVTL